jgi:hypothetical protein
MHHTVQLASLGLKEKKWDFDTLLNFLAEGAGNKRYILSEMQIHLKSIVDGSAKSPKEREHVIYEQVRGEKFKAPTLAAASKLIYLTAMQDILNFLDKKAKFASLSYH